MKRGTFLFWPCLVAVLFVTGCSHCKPCPDDVAKGQVAVTAFVLHFQEPGIEEDAVRKGLGAPFYDSLVRWPQVKKRGAAFEYAPLRTETFQTAAEAFDRAYEIQKNTKAWRVEPMFEMPPPIERGNPLADEKPAQEAQDDDDWSLKQVRASEAWARIRSTCVQSSPNCNKGWEAFGISIAHLDTGYTQHPENWQFMQFMGRDVPVVDVARGYDYCDNEKDPRDKLPTGLLDFPGHGTGSSSVIVSPGGCQLTEVGIKCVSGVGRGAQIVPLRVNTSVIVFNPRNLARAIQDVADGKIDGSPQVISIAMGGFPSLALERAVKSAEDKGVLVIAASGNNIGIVVWPAQYPSVIAVAATNVHCRPWEFSSCGSAVAISAPGESVWRAQLDKKHSWAYINSMSSGTTFATGHTAGAAALWMVRHRDKFEQLKRDNKQDLITEAFRYALKESAWRPGTANPEGTYCTNAAWDGKYGPGILNASGLLDVSLNFDQIERIKKEREESEQLPLFSSLYRADPDKKRAMEKGRIERDYQSLFDSPGRKSAVRLEDSARFETEVMYLYTMNAEFRQRVDSRVRGEKRDLAAPPVPLPQENLSETLRGFLAH
jgi:hypothetical protein